MNAFTVTVSVPGVVPPVLPPWVFAAVVTVTVALAELELLGAAYGGTNFDVDRAEKEIVRCCEQIRKFRGSDPFPMMSTQRQFRRYIQYWNRNEWAGLARAALTALETDAGD